MAMAGRFTGDEDVPCRDVEQSTVEEMWGVHNIDNFIDIFNGNII
jgi:hypothetical protein